jgi:hypothetical protein
LLEAVSTEGVVVAAALLIREDLVGCCDLLKPVVRTRLFVEIWMVFSRQFFVGAADGGLVGLSRDSKDGI